MHGKDDSFHKTAPEREKEKVRKKGSDPAGVFSCGPCKQARGLVETSRWFLGLVRVWTSSGGRLFCLHALSVVHLHDGCAFCC
uniref:Uncharacterized protein n=1 Tax=Chromera velia CCMP2878 TaxID=1169474 RepID=A0A0G4I933_9ALVE|eukprot:Cvel_2024.t1-p1 / transcript=Cvel_2024.t1 / gene=Cvel_2024 / organism=Chromera_velia_CCMP2878 / gene_product=hypothetical protein / transcript_product=hypothetical protein / location=Cvel_scaffold77:127121-127536(+) / protein_length=82 / sequence_SO=supercontig / SO=protein_coding / is_pseudo=false